MVYSSLLVYAGSNVQAQSSHETFEKKFQIGKKIRILIFETKSQEYFFLKRIKFFWLKITVIWFHFWRKKSNQILFRIFALKNQHMKQRSHLNFGAKNKRLRVQLFLTGKFCF